MAKKEVNEKVKPIILHDSETGTDYTLEFNRESVKFAESRGFKIEDVGDYPMTKIPEMFFYAFRAHHKRLSKNQTDKLYEKMGGLTPQIIKRLMELYQQALLIEGFNVEDPVALANKICDLMKKASK